MLANKWVKYARVARPTRKGDAPLLAAYPRRWASRKVPRVSLAMLLVAATSSCVSITDLRPSNQGEVLLQKVLDVRPIADFPDVEVTLTVVAASADSPYTWDVSINQRGKSIFRAERNDAWLDAFFGQQGYMDGCVGHDACKAQWYFRELEALIRDNLEFVPRSGVEPQAWEAESAMEMGDAYLRQQGVSAHERKRALDQMQQLLREGFVSVAVPISPVQEDASYMYVPVLGYFVPYYDD